MSIVDMNPSGIGSNIDTQSQLTLPITEHYHYFTLYNT